jgi:hypothetical protein
MEAGLGLVQEWECHHQWWVCHKEEVHPPASLRRCQVRNPWQQQEVLAVQVLAKGQYQLVFLQHQPDFPPVHHPARSDIRALVAIHFQVEQDNRQDNQQAFVAHHQEEHQVSQACLVLRPCSTARHRHQQVSGLWVGHQADHLLALASSHLISTVCRPVHRLAFRLRRPMASFDGRGRS